jgi:glycogen operon protein
VRAYWKGDGGLIGELAYRLTGSSDLYERSGRRPSASINFITCHDGFTLNDLVSYNDKHNEANLEENHDGESNNRSWNCGVEGQTNDPQVNALRARQRRNFFATLLLSQGVPMILGGDEFGRTQRGNNNSYCQDNELSWVNWEFNPADRELLAFVCRLIEIRRGHSTFRRSSFFQGRPIKGVGIKDITWLTPDGGEMTDEEWDQSSARGLGMSLAGGAIGEDDQRGQPLSDDDFILLLNSHHERIDFALPVLPSASVWSVLIDTSADDGGAADERSFRSGERFPLEGRSLVLLIKSGRMERDVEKVQSSAAANDGSPAHAATK